MGLKIGNVTLDNPFLLAPLAGITDSSYRRLCKEQGAALVYSEMVSGKGLYYDGKRSEELLKFYPEETPIAFQIFGSDPKIMAWAVENLADRGNCIIDVNMGCPVPKVTKNGEGSALMKNPRLAYEIIKAMVEAEKLAADKFNRDIKPITVKCRLGWDENSVNFREFALLVEEAGASAIAIHARTRNQMYSGKADWEAIAVAKGLLSIPVIGNGDVFTAAEAQEMLVQTGCDFVMIARGALGNPWIFRQALEIYQKKLSISQVSISEKNDTISRHIDMVIKEKGSKRGVQEMRKHMGWYFKGVSGAADLRRQINGASTARDLRSILECYPVSSGETPNGG